MGVAIGKVALLCAALALTGCGSGGAPARSAESGQASKSPESLPAAQPSAEAAPAAADADRFHSSAEGFTIVKPSGWLFLGPEAEQANRERVSLGDRAVDEKVRQRALPLVIITKHPETYQKLNPTVKVVYLPLEKELRRKTPREIAAAIARSMEQTVPRFELEGEVGETLVGGRAAGHFRARLTMVQVEKEQSFAVLSRTWIVPLGERLLLIGMSGPPDGDDVSEAEFAQILQSIKIAD